MLSIVSFTSDIMLLSVSWTFEILQSLQVVFIVWLKLIVGHTYLTAYSFLFCPDTWSIFWTCENKIPRRCFFDNETTIRIITDLGIGYLSKKAISTFDGKRRHGTMRCRKANIFSAFDDRFVHSTLWMGEENHDGCWCCICNMRVVFLAQYTRFYTIDNFKNFRYTHGGSYNCCHIALYVNY